LNYTRSVAAILATLRRGGSPRRGSAWQEVLAVRRKGCTAHQAA